MEINYSEFKINYTLLNNKDYISYYSNAYNINLQYYEDICLNYINSFKEDIVKFKTDLIIVDKDVDIKSIRATLNINLTNDIDMNYNITNIIINLAVPFLNITKNTIIENVIIDSYNEYNDIIKSVFDNIKNKLLYQHDKKSNILSYKYLVLKGDILNTVLTILTQYLQEIFLSKSNIKYNTNNEIIVEMINIDTFKTQSVKILKEGNIFFPNNNIFFKDLVSLSVKNDIKMQSEDDRIFLLVDNIFNYSSIINFNTGKVNMVLQLKNSDNRIYEILYKSSVNKIIETFVTFKEYDKAMLLPLEECYISD